VAKSFDYGSGLGNLSSAMTAQRAVGGKRGAARFVLEMEPDARNIDLAFTRWAHLIDDWGPAFKDVVDLFHAHESYHFRTEGKATGRRFQKLSDNYRIWKDKNFPGRLILVRSGVLRDALRKGGPGTQGLKKITKDSLTVGLDPNSEAGRYGRFHSTGAKLKPRGRLPKRPPVRYDPTAHYTHLNRVGNIGGSVPLGTAVGQLIQVYIVKARKEAQADKLFADRYDWRKMRRGVMRLRTK
jgi:hypothetical protein